MGSFSQIVMLGNLTRDPELRYTPQGAAVADLCLAVNRKFTRKDGEKVEEVSFVDVTCWNRLAEISAEFLKKGRPVVVLGHFTQDRWEDSSTGQKRSKLRVVADTLQFVGGGSKDDPAPAPDGADAESAAEDVPIPPKGASGPKPAKPQRR
jgi:single-strand DNA-binding protein